VERALRQHLPGGAFSNVPARSSRNLSAVRGRNNRTTEQRLRLALVRARIKGWQLHPNGIPGRPDFIFPKHRVAIFVDGCFWHGCPRCGHIPKTNTPFWQAKIQRNIERDRVSTAKLCESDFRVERIWEHELKIDLLGCVDRISAMLQSSKKKDLN
jgi:DNA mismatch endonuclease (patch repair protein)